MTREHWNVAICVCWMAAMAVAFALAGPVAALIVFLLPAFLIGALMSGLSKLGLDWEQHLRPDKSRERPSGRHADSNANTPAAGENASTGTTRQLP